MARAVAITKQDSLKAAIDSAKNTAKLVQDFMYGTPERAKYTAAFGMVIAGLGVLLQSMNPVLMSVCSM